jgi:hypothetical protein
MDELFQRMIDAVMDKNISPDIKSRMQQLICANGTDAQFEEAFLRYSEILEPSSEGKLEGEGLDSYNQLAAKLGLTPIAEPNNSVKTTIS